ncbi:hypothetical protein CGSMWGv1400E_07013 [Gardnerella vaginalis 1400E]|uniref:Uncharacterized protein n=1 Tax=Gardnerella vaginalis 1400E TaxID=698956 RepID=I4LSW3_GARVA|nr:hypothetical protein CGSMWGv1400E_07013 [Gardnerella vaginalis 1400E]
MPALGVEAGEGVESLLEADLDPEAGVEPAVEGAPFLFAT